MVSNRLSRLLHKQKFDEAEKFARQFNLDVEVKEKVEAIYVGSILTNLFVGA